MSDDFSKDVSLDLSNLDEDAVKHSVLFAEWAKKWADAVFERDRIKEKLTVFKAELDQRIRMSPEEFSPSGTKLTETMISQIIILDIDHQKLSQELIEAQYNVNILASAKEAFEHRDRKFSVLVELFKSNYFVGKQPNKQLQESFEVKAEESQKENLKLKRRL
jgi:hypothetical protein